MPRSAASRAAHRAETPSLFGNREIRDVLHRGPVFERAISTGTRVE
jgi:hypothetical protein